MSDSGNTAPDADILRARYGVRFTRGQSPRLSQMLRACFSRLERIRSASRRLGRTGALGNACSVRLRRLPGLARVHGLLYRVLLALKPALGRAFLGLLLLGLRLTLMPRGFLRLLLLLTLVRRFLGLLLLHLELQLTLARGFLRLVLLQQTLMHGLLRLLASRIPRAAVGLCGDFNARCADHRGEGDRNRKLLHGILQRPRSAQFAHCGGGNANAEATVNIRVLSRSAECLDVFMYWPRHVVGVHRGRHAPEPCRLSERRLRRRNPFREAFLT